MSHIVLTEEQARIIAESKEGVEVRDPGGEAIVAYLTPLSPEESAQIAEAIQRHAERGTESRQGVPSSRVEAMLQKFHEIDRTEGMTSEKAREIVRRTVSGESL